MEEFQTRRENAIKTRKERTSINIVPTGRRVLIRMETMIRPVSCTTLDAIKSAVSHKETESEFYIAAVGEDLVEVQIGDRVFVNNQGLGASVIVKGEANSPQNVVERYSKMNREEAAAFTAGPKIKMIEYAIADYDIACFGFYVD